MGFLPAMRVSSHFIEFNLGGFVNLLNMLVLEVYVDVYVSLNLLLYTP